MSKKTSSETPFFPGFAEGKLLPEITVPENVKGGNIGENDLAMVNETRYQEDEQGNFYTWGIGPGGKRIRNYVSLESTVPEQYRRLEKKKPVQAEKKDEWCKFCGRALDEGDHECSARGGR